MPGPDIEVVSNELIDRLKRAGYTSYQAVQRSEQLVDLYWREGMDAGDVLAAVEQAGPQRRQPTSTSPLHDRTRAANRAANARVTVDAGPSRRARREQETNDRILGDLMSKLDRSEHMFPYAEPEAGGPASYLDERVDIGAGRPRVEVRESGPFSRRGVKQVPYTTPRAAIAALYKMAPDDLMRLQQQLSEAGFYESPGNPDGRPSFGFLGNSDVNAYLAFFAYLRDHTDLSISEAMAQAIDRNLNARAGGFAGDAGAGGAGSEAPLFVAELSDPDRLRNTIDAVGQRLFGRNVDEATREQIVNDLRTQEEAEQRRIFELDNEGVLSTSGGREAGDPPEDQLRRFMRALSGQESGGDPNAVNERTGAYGTFQIMPGNWTAWARRAGVDPSDRSPAAQERVARRVISDYYRQFGNWRDVAIAWYAGPGAAANPASRDRNRGQGRGNEPTINSYADRVVARMQGIAGDERTQGEGYVSTSFTAEDTEASVEAELRRRDPAGYAATQYATQAREFFDMLGGVV